MVSSFFMLQDLSFDQVKVLVHGMMAVARVDGVHDNEMTLIREFYGSCARTGDPTLETVAGGPFDPVDAKRAFDTANGRKLFLKSLILLAFADGQYGPEEDAIIRDYARVIEISEAELASLHEATKEFMLASLSHVKNVDALLEVQKRLGL